MRKGIGNNIYLDCPFFGTSPSDFAAPSLLCQLPPAYWVMVRRGQVVVCFINPTGNSFLTSVSTFFPRVTLWLRPPYVPVSTLDEPVASLLRPTERRGRDLLLLAVGIRTRTVVGRAACRPNPLYK